MKTLLITLMAALALLLGAQHTFALQSVYINNASFESPAGNPDWTYSQVTGWNSNMPYVGVCASGFADNGQRPDKTQVAFLFTFGGTVNIRQSISGLDPAKKYCLQFWHNARNYTDLYNTNICIFDVTCGGLTLGTITNSAVGGANPYHFANFIFTPANSGANDLRIRNFRLPDVGGNGQLSALLLDGITLFQLGHSATVPEIVVKNPSFEASGEQGPGGGWGFINVTAGWAPLNDVMAGWTYYDGGYNNGAFGTGTNGSPFFGGWVPVPEGQSAFMDNKSEFWYGNSSKQTMLKQTINGLTADAWYYLSYNYQARPGVNNMYSPSNFTVKIGGVEVQRDAQMPWGNTFFPTTVTFKASATSMELVFGTSNSVDGCSMCLDDVEIWQVPEPLALSALGLGLAAWLAGRRAR